MAKKRTKNPSAKKRKNIKKASEPKSPFKHELKKKRNNKLIYFVAGVIIVVMVGTLVLPYFNGAGASKNYKLPNEVLTANESKREPMYSTQRIVVGSTYNRIDKEYYVLFGTTEETSAIGGKITNLPYYVVDSTLAVNKSLTTKIADGKELPKVPGEIKIQKDVALIKIKDGKATKFIDNKKEVEKYVDTLK